LGLEPFGIVSESRPRQLGGVIFLRPQNNFCGLPCLVDDYLLRREAEAMMLEKGEADASLPLFVLSGINNHDDTSLSTLRA
jgi:hypothetical protein